MESTTESEILSELYVTVHPKVQRLLSTAQRHSTPKGRFEQALLADASPQLEELFGIVFASAQNYITRVRSRMIALREAAHAAGSSLNFVSSRSGRELLSLSNRWRHADFSDVEAINAIANYWKHKDEWPVMEGANGKVWDLDRADAIAHRTIKVVDALGMRVECQSNIRIAAQAIGVNDAFDFTLLHIILDDWTRRLCERARTELGLPCRDAG